MEEIWKPVPSYPGMTASSWGRIKLPQRTAKMPNGGSRVYKTVPTYGTKTKASKNARHVYRGYMSKQFGNVKVHRCVCEAFHGTAPEDKPVVLHLDENAENNRPDNLRWGTQKENLNMPGFVEYCRSRKGENNPRVKGMKAKNQ